MHVHDLDRRQFRSTGYEVVGERGGERLALLVVRNLFVERGADALHDAAAHLALDDHRIDHGSAIFRDREVDELDHAGRRIDRHHRAVGGV